MKRVGEFWRSFLGDTHFYLFFYASYDMALELIVLGVKKYFSCVNYAEIWIDRKDVQEYNSFRKKLSTYIYLVCLTYFLFNGNLEPYGQTYI